jgi:hypothetical protein
MTIGHGNTAKTKKNRPSGRLCDSNASPLDVHRRPPRLLGQRLQLPPNLVNKKNKGSFSGLIPQSKSPSQASLIPPAVHPLSPNMFPTIAPMAQRQHDATSVLIQTVARPMCSFPETHRLRIRLERPFHRPRVPPMLALEPVHRPVENTTPLYDLRTRCSSLGEETRAR